MGDVLIGLLAAIGVVVAVALVIDYVLMGRR
jgi:hypothetical protein